MTVGELKRILAIAQDEWPVGVTDHFGDFIEFDLPARIHTHDRKHPLPFVEFPHIDIGEEPE